MFWTARRDRKVANYGESGPDVRKTDSKINLQSEMASYAVGHHKQPVHSDRVAHRHPQPARASEQAQSRKPSGIRGKLRDLLDRSSAHFRAFSTDNSTGLLAQEILSTTHLLLGCADAFVHRF